MFIPTNDDPKRSEWIARIQPALKKARLKDLGEARKGVLARREIIELRAGPEVLKSLGFL